MKLTAEQQAPVNSSLPEGIIRVEALAGTGKTSTLIKLTKNHPDKRFLYLTYNKSMAEEAKRKFFGNVVCKTTHSLCWSRFGREYKRKLGEMRMLDWAGRAKTYGVTNNKFDWFRASVLRLTTMNFIQSADPEVSEIHIPDMYQDAEAKARQVMVDAAANVWDDMCNLLDVQTLMPHDGYLKLYQLSEPALLYDVVLLDEAQDANGATLGILEKMSRRASVVMVGDPYQQIYGFRGSVNALAKIKPVEHYALTGSFRFGEEIAQVANKVLKGYFNCGLNLHGLGGPSVYKMAEVYDNNIGTDDVIIARANATLYEIAFDAFEQGRLVGFAGGFNDEFLWTMRSIASILSGSGESKHPFFSRFHNATELREYAKESGDVEISSAYGLYSRRRDALFLLGELKDNAVSFDRAEVKLTTAHKSKGLQFDNVYVCGDFLRGEEGDIVTPERAKRNNIDMGEEARLFYVALTRAKRKLTVPEIYSEVL